MSDFQMMLVYIHMDIVQRRPERIHTLTLTSNHSVLSLSNPTMERGIEKKNSSTGREAQLNEGRKSYVPNAGLVSNPIEIGIQFLATGSILLLW